MPGSSTFEIDLFSHLKSSFPLTVGFQLIPHPEHALEDRGRSSISICSLSSSMLAHYCSVLENVHSGQQIKIV